MITSISSSPAIAPGSVREMNRRRKEQDFLNACRKVIDYPRAFGKSLSASEIVDKVLAMKAPSYYVSYTHAAAKVQALVNHPPEGGVRRPAQMMWAEITNRASEIVNRRRWMSLDRAVSLVLERGNASGFFMSRTAALRLFHRHFSKTENFRLKRA